MPIRCSRRAASLARDRSRTSAPGSRPSRRAPVRLPSWRRLRPDRQCLLERRAGSTASVAAAVSSRASARRSAARASRADSQQHVAPAPRPPGGPRRRLTQPSRGRQRSSAAPASASASSAAIRPGCSAGDAPLPGREPGEPRQRGDEHLGVPGAARQVRRLEVRRAGLLVVGELAMQVAEPYEPERRAARAEATADRDRPFEAPPRLGELARPRERLERGCAGPPAPSRRTGQLCQPHGLAGRNDGLAVAAAREQLVGSSRQHASCGRGVAGLCRRAQCCVVVQVLACAGRDAGGGQVRHAQGPRGPGGLGDPDAAEVKAAASSRRPRTPRTWIRAASQSTPTRSVATGGPRRRCRVPRGPRRGRLRCTGLSPAASRRAASAPGHRWHPARAGRERGAPRHRHRGRRSASAWVRRTAGVRPSGW